MPTFLAGSTRGLVRRIQPQANAVGAIVTGISISSCLISRIVVSERTSQQFLHSLGKRIYLYVFGDKIGELLVGGLAFYECSAQQEKMGRHGIANALAWYRKNRVSRNNEKVSVTIGDTNLRGYLIGFDADVHDVDSLLMTFTLSFALAPEDAEAT